MATASDWGAGQSILAEGILAVPSDETISMPPLWMYLIAPDECISAETA
jgi:hypothetical protein